MNLSLVNGIRISFIVCCGLWSQLLFAENPGDSARSYFEQSKYAEALSKWYGMVESGTYTAGIYYNIGIAESKLNNTDKAIMAFEKAHRLKPFSLAIKNAILKEREKIENGIIPVRPFFLSEWYHGFLAILRPAIWIFSGLIIAILAIVMFVRYRLTSSAMISKNAIRSPLILMSVGLLFLICGGLSYASIYRDDVGILRAACEIRQAPSVDSPAISKLGPGEKLLVIDQLSGWYHVSLLNLEEGWISGDCISIIEMGR